jgi:AraC-like DNA-binding protein
VPFHVHIKPEIEQLVFRSDCVALGKFRCDATHPLFHDSGPPHDNAVVFPRRMVRIEHHRGPSFVADPTIVPLYNRGQRYTRTAISNADWADWIVVADDVLGEIADPAHARQAVRAAESGEIFRTPFAVAGCATFLAQRRIFDSVSPASDVLRVEEQVLEIVGGVVRGTRPSVPRRIAADVVSKVKEIIGADLARNHSLRALATAVGMTPFHLCRLFQSVSGMRLSEYRHALRLRVALPRIRTAADLATVALDLGYASHSHFTAAFRRRFGITPTEYRRQNYNRSDAVKRF